MGNKNESWNKKQETDFILFLCGSLKTILPTPPRINIQSSVHHRPCFCVPLVCGLGTAVLKTRFIQRINTLTFGRFEGKKKKSSHTMLALQQQQLRATRRVKSTAPFSVHSCLGRHGDSSGDLNMGPERKIKSV